MKITPLIIFLLLGSLMFGCEKDKPKRNCEGLRQGDTFEIAKYPRLKIAEIGNHLCPCNVQCFWAGYVGVTLLVGTDTLTNARLVPDSVGPAYSAYEFSGGELLEVRWESPVDCPEDPTGEDFCLAIKWAD